MVAIFELQCKKGCYVLSGDAKEALRAYIDDISADAQSFGNARGVRNLFEKVLINQANRLSQCPSIDRETLMSITSDDIGAAQGGEDTAPGEPPVLANFDALKAQLDALEGEESPSAEGAADE